LFPTSADVNPGIGGERDNDCFSENCVMLFPKDRVFASEKQIEQAADMFMDAWACCKAHDVKKITCHYGLSSKKKKVLVVDSLSQREHIGTQKECRRPFKEHNVLSQGKYWFCILQGGLALLTLRPSEQKTGPMIAMLVLLRYLTWDGLITYVIENRLEVHILQNATKVTPIAQEQVMPFFVHHLHLTICRMVNRVHPFSGSISLKAIQICACNLVMIANIKAVA
jgi:hypothetical protein